MPDILNNNDVKILQQGSIDLMVESYSNATRTLQIRGMAKEQAIMADIITSSDRSLVTTIIDITDTPIFLTARTATTGVKRGELYVKISMRVDGIVVALLTAGYVGDLSNVAFPGGIIESAVSGQGLIRAVVGTDPAAGNEILETVPARTRWILRGLSYTFITDATVINRFTRLQIDDGANVINSNMLAVAQPASKTWRVTFGIGLNIFDTTSQNLWTCHLPKLVLPAGVRISTITSGIVAGDNFSAPTLLVEEWISA